MTQVSTRPIKTIAKEILKDWKNVNYAAAPYLEAMAEIENIDEMYINESARSIVAYFLSNATAWRGEVAHRIKKELRDMSAATKPQNMR